MKVIFDTDPGIDDAMALMYLNACPGLELLAITTIMGNAPLEQCTDNALLLCDMFDIDVPVHKGSSRVIDGSIPDFYPDFVHGNNGLGDIPLPDVQRVVANTSAAECLLSLSEEYPGEITIIAIGRLTNLALALTADKNLCHRIREVIFMGGALKCDGNVTPWAEANIIGDPEAAKIVFASGIPLTMVGLDVTLQTRISKTFLAQVVDAAGSLGPFVHNINQFYAAFYQSSQNWDSFPVHDSSAVAFAATPEVFTTLRGHLDCVLEGEARGQTQLAQSPDGPHQVCVAVNSEALLEHFQARLQVTYHER